MKSPGPASAVNSSFPPCDHAHAFAPPAVSGGRWCNHGGVCRDVCATGIGHCVLTRDDSLRIHCQRKASEYIYVSTCDSRSWGKRLSRFSRKWDGRDGKPAFFRQAESGMGNVEFTKEHVSPKRGCIMISPLSVVD
jgi:hypothetical protein